MTTLAQSLGEIRKPWKWIAAGGVVLLTLAARMRAFGRIPVSFLLYAVLIGYGTLVVYELKLLEETLLTF